jgi:sterol desaturase/sphingolipid hydroxylase (fatty acid hydroxylase superfamily)
MIVNQYWFWLTLACGAVFALERLFPWRREQAILRPQLGQDLFWIVLNGWFLGVIIGELFGVAIGGKTLSSHLDVLSARLSVSAVATWPLGVQALLFLVVADLVEWCVHNSLHRVGFLWRFHRLHHSIRTMDWLGNFRFHWMEIVIYKSVKYLPLALLGVRWEAILIAAVISTTIGNLNHANLRISWGPLRYLLNSPCMHLWHHDRSPGNRVGHNFAIVFSLWDWLFGTAYMPAGQVPKALGFRGDERYPASALGRLAEPFLSRPQ